MQNYNVKQLHNIHHEKVEAATPERVGTASYIIIFIVYCIFSEYNYKFVTTLKNCPWILIRIDSDSDPKISESIGVGVVFLQTTFFQGSFIVG